MLVVLESLIQKSRKRSFTAGSTIFYLGEAPRNAYIVQTGVVRVFGISDQGEEQIVMHHTKGEFFPSTWIFGKAPGTLFFYEAATDCDLIVVDRQELISHMLATPKSMHALLDYFTTNYTASLIHVNALEQHRARDKLLYILYYLSKRHGKTQGKIVTIPFTLTHQNFASMVGVTRETAATEMGGLKKKGILTYENQVYSIHLDRLIHAMNEDNFKGVDIRFNG